MSYFVKQLEEKMKNSLLVVLLGFVFTGCVNQQQAIKRQEEINDLQIRLDAAKSNLLVTCENKTQCEKAFSLTKVYIQQHSNMKVQFSDDTTVSTYNPTKPLYVGMQATKTPGVGETATIQLTVSCNGMDSRYFYVDCAKRVTPIYEGFKPYIESKLK